MFTHNLSQNTMCFPASVTPLCVKTPTYFHNRVHFIAPVSPCVMWSYFQKSFCSHKYLHQVNEFFYGQLWRQYLQEGTIFVCLHGLLHAWVSFLQFTNIQTNKQVIQILQFIDVRTIHNYVYKCYSDFLVYIYKM